jgi:tetratricopeptide (TPR) repeat protein
MPRTLPDCDPLEIRLTPGPDDLYNVEITAMSGARGFGKFTAPAPLDVARLRRIVDPRARQVRGGSRYLDAARQFGSGLFDALLANPSVREVYTTARRDATAARPRRGVRVTLSLRAAPELEAIPWEFLYDRPRFLANHATSPVVRFVDLEDPPEPLHVDAPLRILGMVSHPHDDAFVELDTKGEQAALKQRLKPLIDAGSVTLRWLPHATLPTLQREVDHSEDFHIFHYIGHGDYDEDTGESSLVLEHDDGRAHRVSGQQLGELLCERGSLRLAVLNACETAQTAPQDPLAGIATSLMEYNVPAVVAMQFAITDESALIFADEFYRALADGYAVDAAVTEARRALAAHSDVEWATPVLFLRVGHGQLFHIALPPAASISRPAKTTSRTSRRSTPAAPSTDASPQHDQEPSSDSAGMGSHQTTIPGTTVCTEEGDRLLKQHRHAEAETTYRTALLLDPCLARAHVGLGRALWGQRRYTEAEAAYQEAIRLDPDDATAYAYLGMVLDKTERYPEAEVSFREAVRLDPGNGLYRDNFGDALSAQQKYPEAEAAYREAIRLEPDNAIYRNDLGVILHNNQKRYAEAEAAFREAVRLDPGNGKYRDNFGGALSAQQKYPEAEAAYREAVRLDPGNGLYHDHLGDALSAQQKYPEAEAAYREAVRLEPDNAIYRNDLGVTLYRQRRYAEAQAAFREAVRLDPANTSFRTDLRRAQIKGFVVDLWL